MRRKTLDALLTAGGGVLFVVLLLVGILALVGYNFDNNMVTNQLAAQKITFPTASALAKPDGSEITTAMKTTLGPYAGKQLLNGDEAKAYADNFIGVHLSHMIGGGVYSVAGGVSRKAAAAAKADPTNAALQATATKDASQYASIFQGTTLRSMLLEAYGFWLIGQIALWVSVAAFILAGLMVVFVALGAIHARRTAPTEVVKALSTAA